MSTTSHLMTAEELIELPKGQHRYELVKGVLLTMSPSGFDHGVVTMSLSLRLATYIEAHQLGVACAAETGFKLEDDPDTVLAPDFAFINSNRNPQRSRAFLEIAPDLAVEVISSTKSRAKVEKKTAQWLSFGVQSEWVVSCQNRTVKIVSANGSRRLFNESDVVTDEAVLQDLRLPVSEIFN